MKYAKIMKNDVVNGKNICVSVFVQGCHLHCKGCFNPETWDFNGGTEIELSKLTEEIIAAVGANGIHRNLSWLGGDPFAPENMMNVATITTAVKRAYPDIEVWAWTGYTLEQLKERNDIVTNHLLSLLDTLIDGPFREEERDITLPYRGSRNQRILHKEDIEKF